MDVFERFQRYSGYEFDSQVSSFSFRLLLLSVVVPTKNSLNFVGLLRSARSI